MSIVLFHDVRFHGAVAVRAFVAVGTLAKYVVVFVSCHGQK